MGMNHPGEIAPLAAIARPAVAVITNVGTAHIEFMKTREAIALEKGSLAEAVPADGCVILNANDDFTPFIGGRCRARIITAGLEAGDVRATDIAGASFTLHLPGGASVGVTLSVPGRHMIGNALLAAAAGFHLGLAPSEIASALTSARLHKGRLERLKVKDIDIIDDSYNANPDSMRAAFATVASLPCAGRRIAVLGRMAELGDQARAGHLSVGEAAAAHAIDQLILVGDEARLIGESFGRPASVLLCDTHAEAARALAGLARPGDLVLVKGSRSAAMENVIQQFSTL
jgi:UDP-N-acetylmuramoyl-tripeptide--D-alanyl-D-alanine ligase